MPHPRDSDGAGGDARYEDMVSPPESTGSGTGLVDPWAITDVREEKLSICCHHILSISSVS